MVRILLLSDLHPTQARKSLSALWAAPARVLKAEPAFDFIVVAGDVSDAAKPSEYAEFLSFARSTLTSLLRTKTPSRIIVVPGNHDVEWGADVGVPWRFDATEFEDSIERSFRKALREYWREPASSELRYDISPLGHVTFLRRLTGERYRKRFVNFQTLLVDKLYARLRAPHRKMNLLAPGQDWSAHVFPDSNVAFFGFNSASPTDRYWRGAGISEESINAARVWAESQPWGESATRIAVWHHGIAGDQGRPDYITLADIGRLRNAGFKVGVHGHVHESDIESVDLLSDSFVIISAGSLGAAKAHRNDAIPNQFSTVELFSTRLYVDTFEAGGTEYLRQPTRRHAVRSGAPGSEGSRIRVRNMRRECVVGVDGIATVTVVCEGISGAGKFPLARSFRGFGQWRGPKTATVRHSPNGKSVPQEVETERLGPDHEIYFIRLQGHESVACVEWEFYVASNLALGGSELQLMEDRALHCRRMAADDEILSFTSLFEVDEVEVSLRFHAKSGARIRGVPEPSLLVERSQQQHGALSWDLEHNEARKAGLLVKRADGKIRQLNLRIEAPNLNCRYSMIFQLEKNPAVGSVSEQGVAAAAQLLDYCRSPGAWEARFGRVRAANKLLEFLADGAVLGLLRGKSPTARRGGSEATVQVETAPPSEELLVELTNELLGVKAVWAVHLWSASIRRLVAAFGRFPERDWSIRFPYGGGVAGHAFRFNKVACWTRQATGGEGSLAADALFQDRPDGSVEGAGGIEEADWIVSVPIGGRSDVFGTISFSNCDDKRPLGGALYQLTQMARRPQQKARADKVSTALRVALSSVLVKTIRECWKWSDARLDYFDDLTSSLES